MFVALSTLGEKRHIHQTQEVSGFPKGLGMNENVCFYISSGKLTTWGKSINSNHPSYPQETII